jgi:hypothetical protein
MKRPPKVSGLPALVKAVLEPARAPTKGRLPSPWATTFLSEFSRLKPAQFEAIGRVAATWSVLEWLIEVALARLSMVPPFPGRALTNDLGIDNRLRALKTLVELHRTRYRYALVDYSTLEHFSALITEIAKLKDRRNRVVHRIWTTRAHGKMFGIRFRVGAAVEPISSIDEMKGLADAIQDAADILYVLILPIPETDEGQQLRSLQRGEHRRPRDAQLKAKAPRRSSPE